MIRKGQFSVNTAIAAVIFTIIGVVVGIPVINSTIGDLTTQTDVTNENINATNDTTQTLANADGNDLVTDSEAIFDGSTTLTKGDNYTTDDAAMTVTFTDVNNSQFDAANAQINYTYQPHGYIENGTSRTVINQIPVILAVGILAAMAVGLGFMNRS